MLRKCKENDKLFIGFFLIIFSSIWIFLFWRCRYGFGSADESFYLTIPYRLYQGDSLFYNEWHLSQMSGFLIYPVMRVYIMIFKSTDAIILNFRYICTFIWGFLSLFVFIRLKKFSKYGAVTSSLSVLIYSPFGIPALSYNSMGIISLLFCFIIISSAKNNFKIQYIISGVFFASSVLCCPYLAFFYIIISVAVIIPFTRKKLSDMLEYNSLKCWLFMTAGIFILTLIFVSFVLSRTSLENIVKSIPLIIDDPEHPHISFMMKCKTYINSIENLFPFPRINLIIIAVLFVAGELFKLKKNFLAVTICFIIMCADIIFSVFYLYKYNFHIINNIMFPLNVLGFYCKILSKNKSITKMFYLIYFPGIFYSFALNYSSNQSTYAISSAMSVSIVSSIIMIAVFVRDIKNNCIIHNKFDKLLKSAVIVFVSVLFFEQVQCELIMRYRNVFLDKNISQQTQKLDVGVEKGLFTTYERLKKYNILYNDLKYVTKNENVENVLYLSEEGTWLYLCTDKRMSSYSAWLSAKEEQRTVVNKLEKYFELCKGRNPDIIFIENDFFDLKFDFDEYTDAYIKKGYFLLKTENQNYILSKEIYKN